MAEEAVIEPTEANPEKADTAVEDMDLVENVAANATKRAREEGEEENQDVSKKQKVDKSVEEERLDKDEKVEEKSEKVEDKGEGVEEGKEEESGPISLGPKSFGSSVEMFDYFYDFLHHWPPNLNINKYEHMVLLDLLKKGHSEPDKKIGGGIQAFQVRFHPTFKSRCFFLIRNDDGVDNFSFRKCVDHILPLPEDMKIKSDSSLGGGKGRGGKGWRGGRGRGRGHAHGHGRGGKSRN